MIRLLAGLKAPPRGAGRPHFEKNASYRTVVPTHTENFGTPAQLKSVKRSRELKSEEKKERKKKDILDPILAIFKLP